MKIKLFTHVDLDGIGCALLAKVAFENVDIEYVNYNDVNEKIKNFIEDEKYIKYDNIYITDISVNEETAKDIDHINCNYKFSCCPNLIIILDHHKTAKWLTKYDWATIIDTNDSMSQEGYKECGTSLFYNELASKEFLKRTKYLNELVNLIRMYDTWEWKRRENEDEGRMAKDLNDILYITGRDEFIAKYLVIESGFCIIPMHKELLRYKRQEIEYYINKKIEQVVMMDRVAFVIADSNISELGSKICELDCDYCAIYTGNNISLRSIGEFDVSIIAKKYGGGGHKNAAGYAVDKIEDIYKLLCK